MRYKFVQESNDTNDDHSYQDHSHSPTSLVSYLGLLNWDGLKRERQIEVDRDGKLYKEGHFVV